MGDGDVLERRVESPTQVGASSNGDALVGTWLDPPVEDEEDSYYHIVKTPQGRLEFRQDYRDHSILRPQDDGWWLGEVGYGRVKFRPGKDPDTIESMFMVNQLHKT